MTVLSIKNKIFPLIVLLLAVTFNSFSGLKKAVIQEDFAFATQNFHTDQSKRSDAEAPQNTEEQENDDKLEDAADPFMVEHLIANYVNHRVNHIYAFQIALYHEHHRVIFSPPPES